jgi:hypothetical protein
MCAQRPAVVSLRASDALRGGTIVHSTAVYYPRRRGGGGGRGAGLRRPTLQKDSTEAKVVRLVATDQRGGSVGDEPSRICVMQVPSIARRCASLGQGGR